MCGIAGFIDSSLRSTEEDLKKMTDTLVHRGPDDCGYNLTQNSHCQIGLGHRRLSIIDITSAGHQPMHFRGLSIVFNGEIYNYREIKNELEELGFTFESHSDTEVILKAFHQWGVVAISRFIGMFAFALYNKEKDKLYLIRDRAGVKPLYYHVNSFGLLFASELKSFHVHRNFKKE